MINFFRLIAALWVIILLTPQTIKNNIILQALHSRRMLSNYGEEKRFLNGLSWFSIFFFLALAFITSIK